MRNCWCMLDCSACQRLLNSTVLPYRSAQSSRRFSRMCMNTSEPENPADACKSGWVRICRGQRKHRWGTTKKRRDTPRCSKKGHNTMVSEATLTRADVRLHARSDANERRDVLCQL